MSEKSPPTEAELIELVRSIDVPAPQALHRRIEAMVADRAPAHRRSVPALQLGFAGGLAIAALAVVLALSLGGSGRGSTLTLHTAVALTQRPPTMAAPSQSAHNSAALAADVEGVAFPYWDDRGWRATGERVDRADGRTITTVYYHGARGQWVGYAIVGGTPAPSASGGLLITRAGVPYRFTATNGAEVMTWLRNGHLCVVAGHGVSNPTLLSLASGQGKGAPA
jgi:hypothetical protein